MAGEAKNRYADFLPAIYHQPDGQGNAAFLDAYLGVLQAILGRPTGQGGQSQAPSFRAAASTPPPVPRKGMAQVLDILPDLFYPRLSFLFPDSQDSIPPLQPTNNPDPHYADEKLAELNSYFGIIPPVDTWTDDKRAAVLHWLTEFLDWQSRWVGFRVNDAWSVDTMRANMAGILPIFRQRGTAPGLQQLLSLYVTGAKVRVHDAVTAPALQVGRNTTLQSHFEEGDPVLGGVRPLCFVVELTVPAGTGDDDVKAKVDAVTTLTNAEKPALTTFKVVVKKSNP